MKKSVFLISVFSVLMLLIAGCSNSSGGSSGNNDENGDAKKSSGSGTVGSSGGVVTAGDDVTITIPEGALEGNTTITVKYISKPEEISDSPTAFIGGVEFGPSGTVFDESVEVKMKLTDEPSGSTISIFCYDEENKLWYFIDEATCSAGYATFKVNHFSLYKGIDVSMRYYSRFETEVKNGIAAGKSDSQIMDSYLDYLLNEEHVMDKYIRFNGYWYKPCGVHVGGDYCYNGMENESSMFGEHGKTNEVKKDTTGLIKVNSGSASYQEFLKNKNKTVDKQDAFYSYVHVYYVMIEPEIEVSASPTVSLKKGEKTKVWVFCYYEELPMADYTLTLPWELKHFSTDTKEIKTNAMGMASFWATGNEKGTDTIKVMFRVEDQVATGLAGGAYSDGYIKLTCDMPVKLNGHVQESYNVKFDKEPFSHYTGTTSPGDITITVSYDFESDMYLYDYETGMFDGPLTFSNLSVVPSSSTVSYKWAYKDSNGTVSEKFWQDVKLVKSELPFENYEWLLSGYFKDGKLSSCSPICGGIYLTSSSNWRHEGYNGEESFDESGTQHHSHSVEITNLYDCDVSGGTSTISKNEFKDYFSDYEDDWFSGVEFDFNSRGKYNITSRTKSTTQTVRITLPEEEED